MIQIKQLQKGVPIYLCDDRPRAKLLPLQMEAQSNTPS
jgi:hypothetical protein